MSKAICPHCSYDVKDFVDAGYADTFYDGSVYYVTCPQCNAKLQATAIVTIDFVVEDKEYDI